MEIASASVLVAVGLVTMTPTARSLAYLKTLGYAARVVEQWNPFAKVRQDVFGADVQTMDALIDPDVWNQSVNDALVQIESHTHGPLPASEKLPLPKRAVIL